MLNINTFEILPIVSYHNTPMYPFFNIPTWNGLNEEIKTELSNIFEQLKRESKDYVQLISTDFTYLFKMNPMTTKTYLRFMKIYKEEKLYYEDKETIIDETKYLLKEFMNKFERSSFVFPKMLKYLIKYQKIFSSQVHDYNVDVFDVNRIVYDLITELISYTNKFNETNFKAMEIKYLVGKVKSRFEELEEKERIFNK